MKNEQLLLDYMLELKSAFDQINRIMTNNFLQESNIIIQRGFKRRKYTLGSYNPKPGFSDQKPLITLWTAGINGNINDVLSILVHEMVHQYNDQMSWKDTENNGRHNKVFKKTAEDIFKLVVPKNQSKTSNIGYADTKISDKLKYVLDNLDLNRELFKYVHDDSKFINAKTLKLNTYKCFGCDLVVTNKRELKLKCMNCGLLLLKLKSSNFN